MNTRTFFFVLFSSVVLSLHAQNEVELRIDGIVVPRTTMGAVISPVEGMIIYDTSLDGFQYYNGSAWATVGAGAFLKTGSLVYQNTTDYDTDDFIFGRSALPSNSSISDNAFFFDQSKAAFRGGVSINSPNWSPDSIGLNSFAYGSNSKASGDYGATTLGVRTTASGDYGATALGSFTEASGETGATALGSSTEASGDYGATALGVRTTASGDNGATALGYYTEATGDHCTVVGRYNDTIIAAGQDVLSDSPLFIVGNGDSGTGNQSNAMVVRKDGNVGIGYNGTLGQLSIKQRASEDNEGVRVISPLNNSSWEMRLTTNGDNLRFRAFADNGDADRTVEIQRSDGAYTIVSDVRLKKEIKVMTNQLDQVLAINPSTYNWKHNQDQTIPSIGVIAQELETLFPELVHTNEDGYKMVNYDGLGVLAIQAIKEQQEEIEGQKMIIEEIRKKYDVDRAALSTELKQIKEMITLISEKSEAALLSND